MVAQSSWPTFLSTIGGGILAIAGGVAAGWWRLKSEREARADERADRRRDRRDEDLRALQEALTEQVAAMGRVLPFTVAGMVPSNEILLQQTAARMRAGTWVARIGDDLINRLFAEWTQLEDEAVGPGRTPQQRQEAGAAMATIADRLNVRAGELLREASESK